MVENRPRASTSPRYLGRLRNFGRVPLLLGHGSDDDNTTAMSSDAILDTYARSARVWFPDKEQGWISAEVTQAGKGAGDKVKLQFIDERGKVHGFSLYYFLADFSIHGLWRERKDGLMPVLRYHRKSPSKWSLTTPKENFHRSGTRLYWRLLTIWPLFHT